MRIGGKAGNPRQDLYNKPWEKTGQHDIQERKKAALELGCEPEVIGRKWEVQQWQQRREAGEKAAGLPLQGHFGSAGEFHYLAGTDAIGERLQD